MTRHRISCRFSALTLLSAFTLLSANALGAAKSFDGVTCEANIPSALIGRQMPNERIVTTEARHKKIGLKHMGTDGMEKDGDPWTLVFWQICGREHLLLQRRWVVKDVLASPLPPGSPPAQIASCTVDGASLTGTAVAFVALDDKKWPKPVEHAWLINDQKVSFSKLQGKKIVCTQ